MTTVKGLRSLDISRRRLLRGAGFAIGGGVLVVANLAPTVASAASKTSQKSVSYQGTPKGGARCDGCTQWQAPAACKIVAGTVAPSGWCMLYAPK